MPTLKGTEAPLSFVQCFLYLASSPINVSIFHSTWLDTFWTDLIYMLEFGNISSHIQFMYILYPNKPMCIGFLCILIAFPPVF